MSSPDTKPDTKKDFVGDFVADIAKALEEGTAPWCKPWKAGELVPPLNPVSKRTYSGMNFVRLASENFADPRFVTFKQADAEGYRVKKGEKGRPVVYWQIQSELLPKLDADKKPVLDEAGNAVLEKYMCTRPLVKYSTVFHASQVDGIPAWNSQEYKHEWSPDERAEAILRNSGAVIKHDMRDRAFYSLNNDCINMRPQSAFPTAGDYYSTALHELAHWTGHSSRMDREFGPKGSPVYAKEELKAEIAAWMLSVKLGLPFDPEQHKSYVAGWSKIIKDEPKFILQACRDAEKICAYCLNFEQEKALEINHMKSLEPPYEEVKTLARSNDTMVDTNTFGTDAKEHFIAGWMHASGKEFSKEKMLEDWIGCTDGDPFKPQNIQYDMVVGREVCPWASLPDGMIVVPNGITSPLEMGQEWFRQYSNNIKLQEFIHQNANPDKDFDSTKLDAVLREAFKEGVKQTGVDMTDLEKGPSTWAEGSFPWLQKNTTISIPRFIPLLEAVRQCGMEFGENRKQVLKYEAEQGFPLPWAKDAAIENTRLEVPYMQRNVAKACGAKWDKENRQWFAPAGTNLEPLARWLPAQGKDTPQSQTLTNLSPVEEFAQAIRNQGLMLGNGELPHMDGEWHRLPLISSNSGKKDGSYMGHFDGKPAGVIINFKTSEQLTWKYSGGHTLSSESLSELRTKALLQQEMRAKERAVLQEKTALRCQEIWEKATPLPKGHAYLQQKGVDFSQVRAGLKMDAKGNILVPLRDLKGNIHSLQTIIQDNTTQKSVKLFAKDGKKQGMSHLLDSTNTFEQHPIALAEGLATAASIHIATGLPISCVFDAGNLMEVTKLLRAEHPDKAILIFADNDQHATPNVGIEKAAAVQKAVENVHFVAPDFSTEKGAANTDFNDYHKLHGLEGLCSTVAHTVEKLVKDGRKTPPTIEAEKGKDKAKNQGMSR